LSFEQKTSLKGGEVLRKKEGLAKNTTSGKMAEKKKPPAIGEY